jgi:hypothetical protein
MQQANIYVHLSCDGGIFICWAATGEEALITRSELLDELASLKGSDGTVFLSSEGCYGKPS